MCWSLPQIDDRGVPAAADTMKPCGLSDNHQSEYCRTCPLNAFESAENGKGKACRNYLRLLCLVTGAPGDTEIPTARDLESGQALLINIPPSSIRTYGMFAKGLYTSMRAPTLAVATEITATPDGKRGGFSLSFSVLGKLPVDALPVALAQRAANIELLRSKLPDPRPGDLEEKPSKRSKKA